MRLMLRDLRHRLPRSFVDARPDDHILPPEERTAAHTRADRIVADLVARSAVKAEIAVALTRLVFVMLVLIRFVAIDENASGSGLARAAIEVPVLLVTAAISITLLVLTLRRPALVEPVIHLSVLLDACACSLTLLPGVLYPWAGYRGLLQCPDIGMLLVLCVSSGLRFSLSAAWFGALSNAALFSGLIALDRARNPQLIEYGSAGIALYMIYLTAAISLGVTLATRGRKLAEQAALYGTRAEYAREGLIRALRDSHDAGSLLSAALLNAAVLREAGLTDRKQRALAALTESLTQLSEVVTQGRQHAYTGVSAVEAREYAPVESTLELVIRRAVQRFPAVRFESDSGDGVAVWLSGGTRTLTSILYNLLVNACEGNGTSAARYVRVTIEPQSEHVRICVSDDGPGFPESMLGDASKAQSSKPRGAGVGLYVVGQIAEANGGRLHLANQASGGAQVTVDLPARNRSTLP